MATDREDIWTMYEQTKKLIIPLKRIEGMEDVEKREKMGVQDIRLFKRTAETAGVEYVLIYDCETVIEAYKKGILNTDETYKYLKAYCSYVGNHTERLGENLISIESKVQAEKLIKKIEAGEVETPGPGAAATSGTGETSLSWIADEKDRDTIAKLINPEALIEPNAINKKFPVKRLKTKELVRYLLNNEYNENTGYLFIQKYIEYDIKPDNVVHYFNDLKKDIPI